MLNIERSLGNSVFIGFDSAWTDAPKAPGAICSIGYDRQGRSSFSRPRLVSFGQALQFIEAAKQESSFCLVALDQPTIVPNMKGSRPVERVAGSVISYIGGGVQPSNRSKVGMFDEDAPVWSFKQALGAKEDPEESRLSRSGLFLIEVFPALALPGLNSSFAQRFGGPKYNPKNRRFKIDDWRAVLSTVTAAAIELELPDVSSWALELGHIPKPRKADQDCLDAAICAIVGLIWRASSRDRSAMIGDTQAGYMVTPISPETQMRLERAALSKGVAYR